MMGFGFLGIGMLLMILFWVAVIIGGVWLVVTLTRQSGQRLVTGTTQMQTPLDVLKTRYARGEISKEQFDEMRRDIGA